MTNSTDKRSQFLNTYCGRELLKNHSLNEYGKWEVFGEDPNCDFGGYHSRPHLGYYQGKLTDVIDIAVDLPSFWSWGAGGDIKAFNHTFVEVDSQTAKRNKALEQELKDLEVRRKEILSKLGRDK